MDNHGSTKVSMDVDDTARATDSELTHSHFDALPELAKWWTFINDSLQLSKADNIPASLLTEAPWINDFRDTIKNLLQTRNIGDRERQTALTLASSMTSSFGTSWLGNDAKLLQLLASIAAIDVRLILDEDAALVKEEEAAQSASSNQDSGYVARCCQLLETALRCAADHADDTKSGLLLTQDQALQINNTLLELTNFVLEYFAITDERKLEIPDRLLYPLYRFVCAYLAEGLALVRRDNLMAAAKPLLSLNERIIAVGDQRESPTNEHFDSMALFLPALSELIETTGSEWNAVKKAFREHGVTRVMDTYFDRNEVPESDREILERWKKV